MKTRLRWILGNFQLVTEKLGKKRAVTFIETIIIINLGLALISSIVVEMLWGQYFGFAVLAGALAWGLPNWYFSRSFKANNFLGKIETLKINFFLKNRAEISFHIVYYFGLYFDI